MSIVTISRGSYSHGKEVAEALANELNYLCLSREIILEASLQFNISEKRLTHALHDAPSLFERMQYRQQQYLNYFKSTFYEQMLQGNIVYHGLAGHFFLQDIPHVFKVRINAGMEDRVEEEMRRERCSENESRQKIKKDDNERKKWSLHLHGSNPWDSRLYDMVLCVDSLNVQDTVDILATTVRRQQVKQTENSLKKLQLLSMQATAGAILGPISPHAKVKVVDSSCIEISHLSSALKEDPVVREECIRQLKKKMHIEQVIFKEQPTQDMGHINTFYNLPLR